MMSIILSLVGFLAFATAAPTTSYEVHEKRQSENPTWVLTDVKIDRRLVLPVSIGLTQRNLENGHDYLMDVADPTSPNYGKHWTPEKIAEIFSPTVKTIEAVKSWLKEHGIADDRVEISRSSGWIRFNSTIEETEDLLQTKYQVFEHSTTKKPHLACDEYNLPSHIRQHIDFITPTIHFDAIVAPPKQKRDAPFSENHDDPHKPGSPASGSHAKVGAPAAPDSITPPAAAAVSTSNTTKCDSTITPDCLRALYGFPMGSLAKSSFGIVEYTPQAYLQSDLNLFYSNVVKNVPSGTAPRANLIDGAIVQTTNKGFSYNPESDLDLEYAIALVYPQPVTLYQVGDMIAGASFGNFLDAIDATYCSSGGGDNPYYDATYPDTNPGGYNKPKQCGAFAATSVISTSYGYNEADLSAAYEIRQCNEYMKLGLAGVTVLYSSGDSGVAGNGDQCCTNKNCAPTSGGVYNAPGAAGSFNPSFPSTCPYVTSVGATQIVSGNKVTDPEVACGTVIYSGGGFSNVFAMPSYQSTAMGTYFKNHKPTYTSTQYNNSQKSRGYPDISANGANYVTAIDGGLYYVYGTSASSPVVGSIITLINQQRIAKGKRPVGFINPTLYLNPSAMNDIIKGTNPGCGTSGFSAVVGWDPVTGLGTPNWSKLLAVFIGLP